MALHCLKSLSAWPLGSTKLIGRKGKNMARPFSRVMNIPIAGYEHRSEVPSERVLSRLSIFSLGHDMPDTPTEWKQELGRVSQEAQWHEKEETQKTARQKEEQETQRMDDSGIPSGPFLVVDGEGRGWTNGGQSEHKDHGSEAADPWIGTDASASA